MQEEEDGSEDIKGVHVVNHHKYGSDVLLTMKAWIARKGDWESKAVKVEVLADSGRSVSIISLDMAERIKLKLRAKGSAT